MAVDVASKWIAIPKPAPDAEHRLFCFSYLGAGVSVYNDWADQFSDDVEVCLVQLPGREERIDESPFNDGMTLFAELSEAMRRLISHLHNSSRKGDSPLSGSNTLFSRRNPPSRCPKATAFGSFPSHKECMRIGGRLRRSSICRRSRFGSLSYPQGEDSAAKRI